jgi:hypothetical protein
MEKYLAEYHIVRHEESKAKLSSEDLMASIKGWLKPVAKLGPKLRQAIAFIFQAQWPERVVPNDVEALL